MMTTEIQTMPDVSLPTNSVIRDHLISILYHRFSYINHPFAADYIRGHGIKRVSINKHIKKVNKEIDLCYKKQHKVLR